MLKYKINTINYNSQITSFARYNLIILIINVETTIQKNKINKFSDL